MSAKTQTIDINDLFTRDELLSAKALYEKSEEGTFNRAVVEKIITPAVMKRINEKTGQENDPSYMGYAIEYAFHRTKVSGHKP